MTIEPLLTVDRVSTRFRTDRGSLRAVDDVSLRLFPGETLGLVGESGSGKSVLGQTIMGLISAGGSTMVSGSVRFLGRDMQALGRREQQRLWGKDIAMVFQDPMSALNPFKRVGTQLTEPLRVHLKLGKAEARQRATDMLRKVRIPEPSRRMDQYPHELSGGMRQRVVIAMALACDPKVTIADEPTTALDVTVQARILDLLESLRRDSGMAGILISHDLGVVGGRTDRVAVMYAGRIIETAPTRELFRSPRHPYTEALLAAVPRIQDTPHTRLESIDGGLPDMTKPISGCAFAPRCRYAKQKCFDNVPRSTESAHQADDTRAHHVACHFPLGSGIAIPADPGAATDDSKPKVGIPDGG